MSQIDDALIQEDDLRYAEEEAEPVPRRRRSLRDWEDEEEYDRFVEIRGRE